MADHTHLIMATPQTLLVHVNSPATAPPERKMVEHGADDALTPELGKEFTNKQGDIEQSVAVEIHPL
jgi:hypothetical protein